MKMMAMNIISIKLYLMLKTFFFFFFFFILNYENDDRECHKLKFRNGHDGKKTVTNILYERFIQDFFFIIEK